MAGKGKWPPYFGSSITSETLKNDENYEKPKGIEEKATPSQRISRVKSPSPSHTEPQVTELIRPLSRRLKFREYVLLLTEACLSLSAYVVRERNFSVDELLRLKLSLRDADINMHLVEGNSAWVCMIFGCLADSYVKHYSMALFSVILHFAAVSIVFMEETVRGNQPGNPYAEHVRTVVNVAIVLIRSTDFTRLAYGLEGMSDRKISTISLFIFFHFWVSTDAIYGGIIVNFCSALFHYYDLKLVIVAFVLSGVSFYLFVYFLHPEDQFKEHRGLGFAVLGCLLLATVYKIFRIRKKGKRGYSPGWLRNMEGTFSKTTIARTKEALIMCTMLSSALAMALFVALKSDIFFETLIKSVKTDKFLEITGLTQLARAIMSGFMLLSYFVVWPLLTLMGFENRFGVKSLLGHLLAAIALLYAAIATKIVEPLQYSFKSGFIRIYNTREKPVYFKPQDSFSKRSFKVQPKSAMMPAYSSDKSMLFAMKVRFDGSTRNTSYTLFLNVVPHETVAYVVLDPPEVVRIRGPFIPLHQEPPRTHEFRQARMYIYNTARSLQGAEIKIRCPGVGRSSSTLEMQPGELKYISLTPASYIFSIPQADITETIDVEEGALYGLLIFASLSTREMAVDRVLDPNETSAWPLVGLYIIIGLSYGLSYPGLRVICYLVAPRGLLALPFTFIACMQGLTMWFMYIGYTTWHHYVTGNILLGYAGGFAIFWIFSTFIFIRVHSKYTNIKKYTFAVFLVN